MEIREIEINGIKSVEADVDLFDVYRTFDCGQAFRFEENNGIVDGVAFGKRIRLSQKDGVLTVTGTTKEEFISVWMPYLALDENYGEINRDIFNSFGKYNNVIYDAQKAASGIRILRQDHWEALCSFIISQNNNIPRIKKIVDGLCRTLGDRFAAFGEECYSFPSPEKIVSSGKEVLDTLRMGFRSKYVYDAAQKVTAGEIDFTEIENMSFDDAERKLMTIYGVGKKVADCTLLYGFHKTKAFPVDVWIKRVIEKYYPDGIDLEKLGNYAGIAQQYLFYYERYLNGKGEQ